MTIKKAVKRRTITFTKLDVDEVKWITFLAVVIMYIVTIFHVLYMKWIWQYFMCCTWSVLTQRYKRVSRWRRVQFLLKCVRVMSFSSSSSSFIRPAFSDSASLIRQNVRLLWCASAAHGTIRCANYMPWVRIKYQGCFLVYNFLRLKQCHRIAWRRVPLSYNDEFCGLACFKRLF